MTLSCPWCPFMAYHGVGVRGPLAYFVQIKSSACLGYIRLHKILIPLSLSHAQLIDNMPKDLNRPWEDPMPDAGERLFTMELRGISVSG